jgi:hypothetical protein
MRSGRHDLPQLSDPVLIDTSSSHIARVGKKGPPTSDRYALLCSRRERNLSPSIRKAELSKFEKHSTERDEPG